MSHLKLKAPFIDLDVEITNEQAGLILNALVGSVEEGGAEEEIEEEIEPEVEETTKTKKVAKTGPKKPRLCGECGQEGHRADFHKKERKVSLSNDPLDALEYDAVMECKADGISSQAAAVTLEYNAREVNAAYGSNSYDNYLKLRKTL